MCAGADGGAGVETAGAVMHFRWLKMGVRRVFRELDGMWMGSWSRRRMHKREYLKTSELTS